MDQLDTLYSNRCILWSFLIRKKKLVEVEKHEKLPYHPNCLRFDRAWEERHRLYIQMELCLMTLAEYADLYGRLDEKVAIKFMIDLTKVSIDNPVCIPYVSSCIDCYIRISYTTALRCIWILYLM